MFDCPFHFFGWNGVVVDIVCSVPIYERYIHFGSATISKAVSITS
jgi:hypothetical protein